MEGRGYLRLVGELWNRGGRMSGVEYLDSRGRSKRRGRSGCGCFDALDVGSVELFLCSFV